MVEVVEKDNALDILCAAPYAADNPVLNDFDRSLDITPTSPAEGERREVRSLRILFMLLLPNDDDDDDDDDIAEDEEDEVDEEEEDDDDDDDPLARR